jgi:hypothetical protein
MNIVSRQPTRAVKGRAPRSCRAFTLLEALMATGLLLGVVIAVTSAITAGQQNAYEAHQRIAGALAAEELMGRLATETYARLPTWNGHTEAVGTMSDMKGQPMASTLQMVGRDVRVISGMKTISGIDVRVRGLTVTVRTFNGSGRTLASIARFVPEPQA